MNNLNKILKWVQSGDIDIAEATKLIEEALQSAAPASMNTPPAAAPEERPGQRVDDSLGYAQLDVDRAARTGFPEVIFGEGKTAEQVSAIFKRLMSHTDRVLATRVSADKAALVLQSVPEAVYHNDARALLWLGPSAAPLNTESYIAVVCAGTSDLPVAEEAAITAESMGCRVERVYDVGVAGIHRLFRRLPVIRGASAIVVAAGMEGALASVLGGLVSVPVYAVPTSIGYGASFQGLAALLAMLNSCAPGISVVNIDNGFGAGYNAALILKNQLKRDEPS